MATSVFVMAHRPYDKPDDPAYRTLFVGSAGKEDIEKGCLRDDRGEDNISDLTPYFSELTGIYWLFKNYKGQENIGACDYRRYFCDRALRVLSGERLDQLLDEYDLITSKNIRTEISYRDSYARAHNVADLDAVGETIARLYPDYSRAFEEVMNGRDQYFGNLFCMPRPLFDEYCQWMFTILLETMPAIDMTGYNAYQQRVYGFLTENLPMVFIRARGLKNYESNIVCTGEKAETREVLLAVRELLLEKRTAKAKSMLQEILKERPEVALPTSDPRASLELTKQILFIKDHQEQTGADSYFARENDLKALIDHYKECYLALSHLSDHEEVGADLTKRLIDDGFDLFEANVILSNDPSERFGREKLDPSNIIKGIGAICRK